MKFIVDAQLPTKLCEILFELGIESIHVEELSKGDEAADAEIVGYADKNDLFVITKDYDFYHSYMAISKPRKLLPMITTGNIRNRQLFDLFRVNSKLIMNSAGASNFMEISSEGIIIHD